MSTPTMTAEQSDLLAARAAAGDSAALAELYIAHQNTVLDLISDRLRGTARTHIEDAAQDVWVEVCEWIKVVEPEGFIAWLVLLADEVTERMQPRPAPKAAVSLPNPFANPLRIASLLRPAAVMAS
ncbi:hypothetical protein ADL26_07900 [Thermoactinomyces vulgaris]|nr:hypothetical protein ADL26_07900 [Thermoactinomyces vulgaris]